jgi:hypothetical protein
LDAFVKFNVTKPPYAQRNPYEYLEPDDYNDGDVVVCDQTKTVFVIEQDHASQIYVHDLITNESYGLGVQTLAYHQTAQSEVRDDTEALACIDTVQLPFVMSAREQYKKLWVFQSMLFAICGRHVFRFDYDSTSKRWQFSRVVCSMKNLIYSMQLAVFE